MTAMSTFGAFIPLWIIGAPLVIGIIEWVSTPKPPYRT